MSLSIRPSLTAPGEALQKLRVRDLAEVVGQIAIDHLVVPPVQEANDAVHRVVGAPLRPVGVLLRLQVRFEYRLKHEQGRCLRHPVPYAGDAQRPELAGLLLRDENLPHRLRCIAPILQFPRQFPKPAPHAIRLDVREGLCVHPGGPAIAANPPPGFREKVLAPHLVDQRVEPPTGFILSFRM